MKKVDITLNNHTYTLACDPSQEIHLSQLAEEVDQRCREIKERMPRAGESMLLVMTALTLADELYEARQEAGLLHEKLAIGETLNLNDKETPPIISHAAAQNLALALEDISQQIDSIAMQVESS
jgi:cell division protein ZapA